MPEDQVPVIFYHNIAPVSYRAKIKGAFTTPKKFTRQMTYLKKKGFQAVPLDDLTAWMKGRISLPQKPVAIVFDDGYRDNFLHAFPVLKEFGFTATFFIVPALMGKSNEWAIQKGEIEKPLLSREEILTMKKHGFSFGSHTMTHPILTRIDQGQAREEIVRSKTMVEELTEKECGYFAYPSGYTNPVITGMVKEAGYQGAFTTHPGFITKSSDPFLMNRFEVKRRQSSRLKFLEA